MTTIIKNDLKPIESTIPLAPYVGGKFKLSKQIIKIINETPHKIYAEPFVGMGGIFFRRNLIPKAEFINDLNGDLVNLFKIVRKHKEALIESLLYHISARAEFERYKNTPSESLTDIERASKFLYLQSLAFGGKAVGQSFGVSKERHSRFNFLTIQDRIRKTSERLASVTIEQKDFEEFILMYDRPETLFYLDPPYYGVEDYYGKEAFKRDDFERLKCCLSKIKGKFLLSINDCPEIREVFRDFKLKEVDILYSLGRAKQSSGELIISNY